MNHLNRIMVGTNRLLMRLLGIRPVDYTAGVNVTETLYDLACRGIAVRFEYGDRTLKITLELTRDGESYFNRYCLGDPLITNPDHESDEVLAGLLQRLGDELEARAGGVA